LRKRERNLLLRDRFARRRMELGLGHRALVGLGHEARHPVQGLERRRLALAQAAAARRLDDRVAAEARDAPA
jgi:hypothetical protein